MASHSNYARKLGAAVSLLALAAPTALAQAPDAAAEEDVIVVRSAPLQLASEEMVGSVEVVSARQIERDLNGNIADTLDRLPGVSSTYFGPAAGRPIVRGLGADRVRMLINGLGALDASSASPDHAVSAEALGARQIEVLRGPAAIAYGGGAVGGVVNVLDGRIPTERNDDRIDGYAYLGATSVDEGTQAAGRVTADFNGLMIQLEGLKREGSAFDIPGFAETEALREEHHHEDENHEEGEDHEHEEEEPAYGEVPDSDYTFETYSGAVSLVRDWGFIGLSVKETDAEYGLPGHSHAHEDEHDHEEGEEDHDEDEDHDHEHEGEEAPRLVLDQTRIDLRGELNRDALFNRIRWSFAHAHYTHAELEEGEIGTLFRKNGFEGRVELAHDHGDNRQGAWGVQALTQDFSAEGEEGYIEPVTTQDWGAFVTERWDNGDWGLEGGLRVETRELSGQRATRSFDTVSGSGSLFIRPTEDWFIAATLSRTERAPTDAEVFADGPHAATRAYERGSLDLDTETAWSGEFTARFSGQRLSAEGNVFYADYDGFIGLFPTGEEEDGFDVFEYRQADTALYGFEALINADLGAVRGWAISGELGLDYVRGKVDGGGDLPRIPPLSSNLALIAEQGIWSVRGEAQLVADQDETAAFETETDGYALFNADLEVTPFTDRDVRVILGVRNITDEEGRVHTSFLKDQVPLPGRNFRIAVRTSF
ncbi:TonB-dependent receptor [Oceanicaulis sp. LC35]|uniref:TonB-dependent receptor n=1 Tax=Oceanicaulis sp. LC35 TaxID=3349635 RepID=UPI003F84E4DD